MPDQGNKLTDAELAELEKKIVEVYKEAADELQKTIEEYFEKFEKRDEEMKKLIGEELNGKVWTEEDYKQWRLAQIGRGERYEALRDKIAERYTEANETAIAYINDTTPTIYTLNRNYAAYTLDEIEGADFTLWNEQTVRRLIKDNPDLMPYYPKSKAVKRGIDLEYGKKYISKCVTSGILRGESTYAIAKSLQNSLKNMETASAIRTARTAITSAQNGGRQAQYEAAEEMGIDMKRQWVSTLDFRTRHAHGEADGQIVGLHEPFEVGGEQLMFPGDPSGSGWNIYNCRCHMARPDEIKFENEPHMIRVKVEEYDEKTGRTHSKYELREKVTYAQWKKEQEAKGVNIAKEKRRAYNTTADKKQYENYSRVLKENAPDTLAEFKNIKYTNPEKYEELKYQYRTVNRYDVTGNVSVNKILELDKAAWYTKQNGFVAEEGANSKRRGDIKKLRTIGNAASMEYNGKIYFAHSSVQDKDGWAAKAYTGDYPLVVAPTERRYTTTVVHSENGKSYKRENDTEVKFFEYLAKELKPNSRETITMLTEKCMCESCQGVMKQFQEDFPNVTINIIQGRKDYNNKADKDPGTNTWRFRKRK